MTIINRAWDALCDWWYWHSPFRPRWTKAEIDAAREWARDAMAMIEAEEIRAREDAP